MTDYKVCGASPRRLGPCQAQTIWGYRTMNNHFAHAHHDYVYCLVTLISYVLASIITSVGRNAPTRYARRIIDHSSPCLGASKAGKGIPARTAAHWSGKGFNVVGQQRALVHIALVAVT